ncbi:MAG: hypothetical protein H8E98_05760 [Bacteroidetes bacterium]|nr:hypothetical protein [Bacteroidota bacterium]
MKPHLEFNLSKKVIDFCGEKYNCEKNNSTEKLKRAHLELMYELVRLYRSRLNNNNLLPEYLKVNYDKLSVSTNNKILAERLHCSVSAIKRQRERLRNAGMITEIWHGTNNSYEVFIETGFLAVFDLENPGYSPKLNFVEYQETKVYISSKRALFTVSYRLHLNKTVIVCEKLVPFLKVKSINVGNTSLGYTQKRVENVHKNNKNNEDYWEKVDTKAEKLQQLKRNAAKALVNKYVTLMLKDKEVFAGEIYKAANIVEENYFPKNDSESINYLMGVYLERIDFAKKYSEMNEKYQAPFPARYFDIHNHRNGFTTTKKWYADNKNWNSIENKEKRNEKQNNLKLHRELEDEKKLSDVLKLCLANPTIDNFINQDKYVHRHLPTLIDKYYTLRRELLSAKSA